MTLSGAAFVLEAYEPQDHIQIDAIDTEWHDSFS